MTYVISDIWVVLIDSVALESRGYLCETIWKKGKFSVSKSKYKIKSQSVLV